MKIYVDTSLSMGGKNVIYLDGILKLPKWVAYETFALVNSLDEFISDVKEGIIYHANGIFHDTLEAAQESIAIAEKQKQSDMDQCKCDYEVLVKIGLSKQISSKLSGYVEA